MFLQVMHVRVTSEEPKQFVYNGLQVQSLGRKQGKSLFKVKAHLMAEYADRTRTRAVFFSYSLVEDAAKQIQILFHTTQIYVFLVGKWIFGTTADSL